MSNLLVSLLGLARRHNITTLTESCQSLVTLTKKDGKKRKGEILTPKKSLPNIFSFVMAHVLSSLKLVIS